MTVSNKTKKFISGLLIILILLPSVLLSFPKTGYAVWGAGDVGTNPIGDFSTSSIAASSLELLATSLKDLALKYQDQAQKILQELAKAVAKKVLAEMTKSTINWINSDFHGSPLFLTNPQSFFGDIAKSQLKNIVNTYGYNNLLYPFGKQFALDAINLYKTTQENNATYTLSNVMNSAQLNSYRNDFSYGGWNGFLTNTQYPQNNVLGFQMIATQQLANDVRGTQQSAAEGVKGLLAQGAGFLSPQKCATNPKFNNGTNEFTQPSFDDAAFYQKEPQPALTGDATKDSANLAKWNADYDATKKTWTDANTCPPKKDGTSGFENTTPGSVAANSIMTAINSPFLTTALDGAVGNSLSAVFDALISHYLDKGLSALSSTINPAPVTDDWSYNGQTVGSPLDAGTGTNSTDNWNGGPDQPIVLSDFKNTVNQGINSLNTEIRLMYNEDPVNPGIYQYYSKVWPEAQKLDECIPGPDVIGLKDRVDAEVTKARADVQTKASGFLSIVTGGTNQDEVDSIIKELTSAMKFFKAWIDNKMMPELPSSLAYIDAVNSITKLSQGMDQLNSDRMAKNTALARLQAIKTNLDLKFPTNTQPDTGSAEEQTLVSIWKQYQGASTDLSNTNTIENTRNKLSEVKDMYNNFVSLLDINNPLSCPAERAAKGWSNPGGPSATWKNPSPSGPTVDNGKTEEALFCSLPSSGGYSHPYFGNSNVTYPEIPLVNPANNGQNGLQYKTVTIASLLKSVAFSFTLGGGFIPGNPLEDASWVPEINCNNIFNARASDYKGDLPGNLNETPLHVGDTETLGNCRYINGVIDTDLTKYQCTQNSGTWGPLEPLGTCTIQLPNQTTLPTTLPIPNTLQSECKKATGVWLAN